MMHILTSHFPVLVLNLILITLHTPCLMESIATRVRERNSRILSLFLLSTGLPISCLWYDIARDLTCDLRHSEQLLYYWAILILVLTLGGMSSYEGALVPALTRKHLKVMPAMILNPFVDTIFFLWNILAIICVLWEKEVKVTFLTMFISFESACPKENTYKIILISVPKL